ncbi:hypothetical protein D9M73_234320 [compost metagenome]
MLACNVVTDYFGDKLRELRTRTLQQVLAGVFDGIDDVAGYRLHQRIADLPRDHDVRVLLGGNVHFAHQGRGGH